MARMKRVLLALALLLPALGFAQQYSIDWYKIAGGGGTSSNGQYVISGTIGQADAGTMGGGNYSLTGGFWSLLSVVQSPGAPLLSIHLTATNTVLLSWPVTTPAYNLQKSATVSAPSWGSVTNTATVVNGQNQVLIAPPVGNSFFRLTSP